MIEMIQSSPNASIAISNEAARHIIQRSHHKALFMYMPFKNPSTTTSEEENTDEQLKPTAPKMSDYKQTITENIPEYLQQTRPKEYQSTPRPQNKSQSIVQRPNWQPQNYDIAYDNKGFDTIRDSEPHGSWSQSTFTEQAQIEEANAARKNILDRMNEAEAELQALRAWVPEEIPTEPKSSTFSLPRRAMSDTGHYNRESEAQQQHSASLQIPSQYSTESFKQEGQLPHSQQITPPLTRDNAFSILPTNEKTYLHLIPDLGGWKCEETAYQTPNTIEISPETTKLIRKAKITQITDTLRERIPGLNAKVNEIQKRINRNQSHIKIEDTPSTSSQTAAKTTPQSEFKVPTQQPPKRTTPRKTKYEEESTDNEGTNEEDSDTSENEAESNYTLRKSTLASKKLRAKVIAQQQNREMQENKDNKKKAKKHQDSVHTKITTNRTQGKNAETSYIPSDPSDAYYGDEEYEQEEKITMKTRATENLQYGTSNELTSAFSKLGPSRYKAFPNFEKGQEFDPWYLRLEEIVYQLNGKQRPSDADMCTFLKDKLPNEILESLHNNPRIDEYNLDKTLNYIIDFYGKSSSPKNEMRDLHETHMTKGSFTETLQKVEKAVGRSMATISTNPNDTAQMIRYKKKCALRESENQIAQIIISALIRGEPAIYEQFINTDVIDPTSYNQNYSKLRNALIRLDKHYNDTHRTERYPLDFKTTNRQSTVNQMREISNPPTVQTITQTKHNINQNKNISNNNLLFNQQKQLDQISQQLQTMKNNKEFTTKNQAVKEFNNNKIARMENNTNQNQNYPSKYQAQNQNHLPNYQIQNQNYTTNYQAQNKNYPPNQQAQNQNHPTNYQAKSQNYPSNYRIGCTLCQNNDHQIRNCPNFILVPRSKESPVRPMNGPYNNKPALYCPLCDIKGDHPVKRCPKFEFINLKSATEEQKVAATRLQQTRTNQ